MNNRRKIKIENIIKLIKQRWKFYLIGYVVGYIVPLMYDGIPSAIYLVPIKVICIICAIAIGTPLYYGSIRMPVFECYRRAVKYIILIFVAIVVSYIITTLLYYNFDVDITPFIGMDFIE